MGQETNRKMEPTFYTKANTSDEDEYQAEKGVILLKPITVLTNS